MNKGNIIRSIFWGFVLILFLVLGTVGIIRENKIYNEYKNELSILSKNFNQNEIIENYKQVNNEITSKIKDKKIIITSKSIETTEYVFKLKNGYISTEIDKNDTFGKTIVMAIADSIAVNKGLPMGSTYSIFNDNTVLQYKLNDGIEYKNKKDSYIINISLINPIINNNNNQNNEILDNNGENENNNFLDGNENNTNSPVENNNNEENNPNMPTENNYYNENIDNSEINYNEGNFNVS